MKRHPLEIVGPPSKKKARFLQPRFPQIGPAGNGPRALFIAQSGQGKTTAAMVMLKEYIRICERIHMISGTIDLDEGYSEVKK